MIIDTEVKYRPRSLAEFVFPNSHVKEVVEAYASGDVTRPLIIAGSNGTGKSLLAELIPKAIDGDEVQVNKVRASDLNSNKEVYAKFTYNKHFDKLFTTNNQRYGYNVIEEVNIDAKARDAFRTALDDYRGVDLTIITTNQVEQIDIGIRSRAEVLTVPPCSPETFLPYAQSIIEAEGFAIDSEDLLDLLRTVHDVRQDNRSYYKKLDEVLRKASAVA